MPSYDHNVPIAVTSVEAIAPYRLYLVFNDGTHREVDLSDQLKGPVFEPLHDFDYFRQVRVDERFGTVVWPNGLDLDPDVLHGSERAASGRRFDELSEALKRVLQRVKVGHHA